MKNLLAFLLICLPLWAIAQDKPAKVRYDPGKWYVGVRLETYWFSTNGDLFIQSTQVPPSAVGAGFNVWFGQHVTRHIDVQAGMFFDLNSANSATQSIYTRMINDTTTYQQTRFIGRRPFYLPVVLKVTPFGSHRRIQPYLLAGVSMAVGRANKTTREYDTGRPVVYNVSSEKEGIKALFGAYMGIGLKVRVVDRISLSLDGAFGKNLTRNGSITANGGFGFLYDIAPAQ
jgi:hypothetical protein